MAGFRPPPLCNRCRRQRVLSSNIESEFCEECIWDSRYRKDRQIVCWEHRSCAGSVVAIELQLRVMASVLRTRHLQPPPLCSRCSRPRFLFNSINISYYQQCLTLCGICSWELTYREVRLCVTKRLLVNKVECLAVRNNIFEFLAGHKATVEAASRQIPQCICARAVKKVWGNVLRGCYQSPRLLASENDLQMANEEQNTDNQGLHILSGSHNGGLWILQLAPPSPVHVTQIYGIPFDHVLSFLNSDGGLFAPKCPMMSVIYEKYAQI